MANTKKSKSGSSEKSNAVQKKPRKKEAAGGLKAGRRRLIRLTGSLTLPFAEAMLQQVRAALEQSSSLEIDISGSTEVDLSCLQLLCSAHRTAVRDGKRLTVSGAGAGFAAAVHEAGFVRSRSCSLNPDSQCLCLWVKEKA